MTDIDVPSSPMRITAVMTVHNRRALTLRCLSAIAAQRDHGADVSVVVCDDGSTDGTAAAIADTFPEVIVVHGDGSLFYSGGMRKAWAAALPSDADAYWLLNDDTDLDDTALRQLLGTYDAVDAGHERPVLIVGTTREPGGQGFTYGGVRQRRFRRMHFDRVRPAAYPQRVDTMNGNCVLVSHQVVARVGMIDEAFRHSMGDYDYGLRARQHDGEVWLAPGSIGSCAPNPGFVPSGNDARTEFQRLLSVRNLPPREWHTFVRRWGGPQWPLLWVSPYLRRLARIVRTALSSRRA